MQPGAEPEKATVLFVEDDCAMLSLGRIALEAAGYDVLPAANGQEAVRHYTTSHADIDFAVVDLVLPDMHGIEVIRKLIAIDKRVRILVATGLNREEAREALKAGALDVIPKPYSISNLRDRLQRFSPATIAAGAEA